jgi:alkenylglycerophosphocholine/alkenylglycerophosphoethanolamine hydrolase
MSLTRTTHASLYLACGLAVAYLLAMPLTPYPGAVLTKMLPCLALSVACWQLLEGKIRNIMTAALLLSAIADGAITVAFLAGLLVFLCVQLSYCVAFFQRSGAWRQRAWLLALIAGFYVWALLFLAPRADEMAIPVGVYMSAICAMGVFAAGYRGSWLVPCGALAFMVSDTLIGVNRFWLAVPFADLLIMSTYYLGQIMIVAGVIKTERAP